VPIYNAFTVSKRVVWHVRSISRGPAPNHSSNSNTPSLDSLPCKMPASTFCPHPGISVPHDVLTQPLEERTQLAITAIQDLGTRPNGDPCYSARQAEQHFGVPRTSLGRRLKGAQCSKSLFCIIEYSLRGEEPLRGTCR
jgi:hypothetical protein